MRRLPLGSLAEVGGLRAALGGLVAVDSRGRNRFGYRRSGCGRTRKSQQTCGFEPAGVFPHGPSGFPPRHDAIRQNRIDLEPFAQNSR